LIVSKKSLDSPKKRSQDSFILPIFVWISFFNYPISFYNRPKRNMFLLFTKGISSDGQFFDPSGRVQEAKCCTPLVILIILSNGDKPIAIIEESNGITIGEHSSKRLGTRGKTTLHICR